MMRHYNTREIRQYSARELRDELDRREKAARRREKPTVGPRRAAPPRGGGR